MQAIKRISSKAVRLSSIKHYRQSFRCHSESRRFTSRSTTLRRCRIRRSNAFLALNHMGRSQFSSSSLHPLTAKDVLLSHRAVSDAALMDVECTLSSDWDCSLDTVTHSVAFVTANHALNRKDKGQLISELLESCQAQSVPSPSRIVIVDVMPASAYSRQYAL